MDTPLAPDEIQAAILPSLPGWRWENDAFVRKFEFGNLREAFAFMSQVAIEAERMNHHPEWTNIYDEVTIRLTTHHAGNVVTQKDVDLARRIQEAARGMVRPSA